MHQDTNNEDLSIKSGSLSSSSQPSGVVVGSGARLPDFVLEEREKVVEKFKEMTEVDWMEIFPQAKSEYGYLIRNKLRMMALFHKLVIRLCDQDIERILNEVVVDVTVPEKDIRTEAENRSIGFLGVQDYHKKVLKRIERDMKRLKDINRPASTLSKHHRVSDADIARARQIDLSKLLEINRSGFAQCFNHDDTGRPNLYCKNGYAWCFVCQSGWNPISIVMARDKMTFPDAVRHLISL